MAPQRIRKTFSEFAPDLQIHLKRPCSTACNQLSVLTQKDDEELEEFAEQALQLSMDAWSDTSIETANQVAQEAFLHRVQDKEAALITMNRSPANLDEALETLKKIIHDKRSLAGRVKQLLQRWSAM